MTTRTPQITNEQRERLPFYDSFPVDVQIRIESDGGHYKAYMQVGMGPFHHFPLQVSKDDIKDLNSTLQKTIQDVQICFEPNSFNTDEQAEALEKLASKGSYAFKKIFADGIARESIDRALAIGSVIQFSSEDFFIPWELLYDRPIEDNFDVNGFWGMRYVVSRALIQPARPGDFVTPIIQSSRPRVGMIICKELTHVANYEIPALQKLQGRGLIYLSVLPPLAIAEKKDGLRRFGRFLVEEREVVHLACHAFEREPLSESCLVIEDSFEISLENFKLYEYELKHFPLVILNACRTGTMSPGHTSNWASQFWSRGARGVVATEFRVPDWFAALFIEKLYKGLLSRKPLGKSLIETRHYFWDQKKNPLGLAYALYSSPLIRFAR